MGLIEYFKKKMHDFLLVPPPDEEKYESPYDEDENEYGYEYERKSFTSTPLSFFRRIKSRFVDILIAPSYDDEDYYEDDDYDYELPKHERRTRALDDESEDDNEDFETFRRRTRRSSTYRHLFGDEELDNEELPEQDRSDPLLIERTPDAERTKPASEEKSDNSSLTIPDFLLKRDRKSPRPTPDRQLPSHKDMPQYDKGSKFPSIFEFEGEDDEDTENTERPERPKLSSSDSPFSSYRPSHTRKVTFDKTRRNLPALVYDSYDAKRLPPPKRTVVKPKTQIAHRSDFTLIILALMASLFGVVLLFGIAFSGSADATVNALNVDMVYRHIATIGIGLIAMLIIGFIDYHHIIRYGVTACFVTWMLAFTTLFVGERLPGEPNAWLMLGGLTFNTGSLLLLPILLMLPNLLSKHTALTFKTFLLCAVVAGVTAGFAILQWNFPMTIIIVMVSLMFLYIKKPFLASFGFFGSLIAYFFAMRTFPQRTEAGRFIAWLDPFSDPAGFGWQPIQSLHAIASGGVFGQGIGAGEAAVHLPDAASGFILALISNQLGIIGAVIILCLLILIVTRIGFAAAKAKDPAGFYLCMGISAYFAISIILNTLVVVNAIPAMNFGGLPFVSYGGTNLVIDMMLLGIALNVSRQSSGRPIFAKGGQNK